MIDKRDVFTSSGLDLVDEIIELYKGDDNIKALDVGCGSGYSVNCLCEKGFDATGIDYCEEIINLGKEKYKNIDLQVMDANNIDFPKNYFDLIIFECSLSIMKNPESILSNCKELLKQKGIILLSDFYFKKSDNQDNTYTIDYWNTVFDELNLKIIKFEDKYSEWRNFLGMVLWEYGDLSGLLMGNENDQINKDILKKETGYFFTILKKED